MTEEYDTTSFLVAQQVMTLVLRFKIGIEQKQGFSHFFLIEILLLLLDVKRIL